MSQEVYAFPMSSGQRRLWLLHRMRPDSPAYDITAGLVLRGRLDPDLLQAALDVVVARHESLRTTFEVIDGEPMQVVSEAGRVLLRRVDLRHLAPEVRARAAEAHTSREVRHLFDLSRGPLLRVTLLRMADDEHRVLTVLHHVIGDGWSMGVLHRELTSAYAALAAGREPELPELPLQVADVSEWQREALCGPRLERLERYWEEALADAPRTLDLPLDRPRRRPRAYRGGTVELAVPAAVHRDLRALARDRGVTLYALLLAAFGVVLSRRAGSRELCVGSPVAGRSRPELEPLIGFLLNTLVMRLDLRSAPSFLDLVDRVHETALGALEHQELPFDRVVELLDPPRDPGSSPLFQVLFVLQNTPRAEGGLPGLEVQPLPLPRATTQFDLGLSMQERDAGGLEGVLEYDAELFDPATVEDLAAQLGTLLGEVARDPTRSVERLPLAPREAVEARLRERNATSRPYDLDRPLYAHFGDQVARTPDAPALSFEGATLTYRELDRAARRAAASLAARGVTPGERVGLLTERSLEQMVGLYAILAAGAVYVPLDPAQPDARLRAMVEDAGVRHVLVQETAEGRAASLGGEPVTLRIAGEGEAAAPREVPPQAPAYVLFTSGSTGRPKGVEVSHRSLVNRLLWMQETYPLGADDVVLQKTSLGFDVSLWELLWPLQVGARLALAAPGEHRDPARLAERIRSEGVTTLHFVPSLLAAFLEAPGAGGCPSLRRVICSGEALPPRVVERFHEVVDAELHNLYGPTEAAVDVTHWDCAEGRGRATVPIGRPIANTRLYVLDDEGEPCPSGVPGELCVGGVALAHGYVGRPGRTAESFVPDPLAPEPGARVYRTGDRARWLPDGSLEYLGRLDAQVKLRGVRVELGEVEAALAAGEGVAEAAAAVKGTAEDPRLLGYVVLEDEESRPDPEELRAALPARLPPAMVPEAVIAVDALPRTASGKLDRGALPEPSVRRAARAGEAPRGDVEERLARLWEDVLGVEGVGRDSSFFDLGGHSLQAMRLVARLEREEDLELALQAVFEHPTLAAQAARVRAGGAGARPETLLDTRRSARPARVPLSHEQEGLWFLESLHGPSAAYDLTAAFRLRGPLDLEALRGAFEDLARRHESLRTSFAAADGEPYQVIHDEPVVSLDHEDLRDRPAAARDEAVQAALREEALRPFDLGELPLFRLRVLAVREEEHVLVSTFHHMIFDGWSTSLLVREVGALYAARRGGAGAAELPPPVQYAEYALAQRRGDGEASAARDLAYWRERLAGIPAALELPTDRPRTKRTTPRGQVLELPLGEGAGEAVASLAARAGATPFQVLVAATATLLHRDAGADDVVIGSPVARRDAAGAERILGFLVQTLALRIDLRGDPSFREVVARTRSACLEGLRHGKVPFHRVVEEVAPGRGAAGGGVPFPQVLLAFQELPEAELAVEGLEVSPLSVVEAVAKADLTVAVEAHGGRSRVRVEYDADLFQPGTVRRMVERLGVLLQDAARRPDHPVGGLEVLPAGERQRLLGEWAGEAPEGAGEACVHHLFEAAARERPEAVAVVLGDRRMTYGELDARANRLAHRLVDAGLAPDDRVGVLIPRSPECLVALLGVLKAGGAYVPLDESNPADRLAGMAHDAGVRMLLTAPGREEPLPFPAAEGVPVLEVERAAGAAEPAEAPDVAVTPDHLAYVSFTSGSTGRPKGVAVPHRGVARLVRGGGFAEMGPEQVFLGLAPLSFDASTLEVWGALTTGARLVLMPPGLAPLDELERVVRENGVNTLWLTAGLFHLVVDERISALRGVTQLLAGGDVLSPAHVARVLREVPGCRVINGYGPTENTTFTCCHPVDALDEPGASLPIGRPIGGTRVYVLDPEQEPVPVGVAGELYAGGAGLARGYVGQPARTAERFVPDPFGETPGGRLYRTGDRARFTPEGTLEFLGRLDAQVKIRGFRVEPGEVEARLLEHPEVADGVVVVVGDGAPERRLVAYLVARAPRGAPPPDAALRDHVAARLPAYMVPDAFVWLGSLPLNVNGKVDRRALPDPGAAPAAAEDTPPRTALERRVAETWAEVLGRGPLGVHADFFALGGHSLLATQVVSRLRERVHPELALASLFEHPTIARLAAHLERLGAPTPPAGAGRTEAREEFEI